MSRINKTPIETRLAIERRSAAMLPDRPTQAGLKPWDIRNALFSAIIADKGACLMGEIDRIVDEANAAIDAMRIKSGTLTVPMNRWKGEETPRAECVMGAIYTAGCAVLFMPEDDETKEQARLARLSMAINETMDGEWSDLVVFVGEGGDIPIVDLHFRYIVIPTESEVDAVVALIGVDAYGTGGGGAASGVDQEAVKALIDKEVPEWARAKQKPEYTPEEVKARPATWTPTAEEVGARPSTWMPTADEVGARPNTWTPTAGEVGAESAGKVKDHNEDGESHVDIRLDVTTIRTMLAGVIGTDTDKSMRAVAALVVAEIVGNASDSFDTLEEIAAWIEAHPNDVAAMVKRITDLETAMGGKVSKTDIINTLDSTALDKPLSAAMGKQLAAAISQVNETLATKTNIQQVSAAITDALKDYLTTTKAAELYQPKEAGKGLSTNDYTDADKAAVNKAASDSAAAVNTANQVKQMAGNGELDGENGKTYTPHFATDGTLYWTNDGDLPNPDPVNLIDLMRDELGLEEDAGEAVEYESYATEAELVAGGDTTKVYVVEETGTLWAYQTVEVGEVRKQIFDPESKITGHMSGTKISSSTNELYLLPVDTSQIPEGEVAYLEVNGIYKKTSSTAPKSQKIGYSALASDSIAVAENQLIKCAYTETRATAGTDYPTEEEIAVTSTGMTVKVGYLFGTILDGYETIKTLLIEVGAISDASAITAYLVHDGGTTKQWVDTGEAPPAPGTNTNYTDLLLRVNAAEDELAKHEKRITKQENQSDTTETFDDYWQTAYDAAVAKVKAKQDEGGVNVECFIWFSDFHYYSNTSSKHLLNVGRLSAAIMDACDIPFAILSGDTLTAATLTSEALVRQALQGAMSLLSPIGEERLLLARGNHDDVYGRTYNEDGTTNVTYVNKVSSAVTYNELHRWQAKDYRRVFGDESGTYFYIDTPQHTRHIILNCQYYDGGSITNGTTKAMTTGMGESQLAWLKDKALAVEDGMTVTITLHFPPTSQNINGHTYWIDGWPDDANALRTIVQESTADIAAIFCGHCHADAVVTGDLRCPIITTTCAINTPYDADPATRVIGTDTETAINIVCIDKREDVRKIDVIRLGYGADRLNISY